MEWLQQLTRQVPAHLKLKPTLVYGYCCLLWTGGASVGDGADVQPQELLGRGRYGQVHRSIIAGKQVATKAFDSKSCAMREVAVAASFEPHPNIIRLLDVHVQGKKVIPVYPLYPGTLAILARAPWSRRNSSI
jgi:hypothetical protein